MIARGMESIFMADVHEKYSDFDIAHRYLGITCLPEIINSPLRQDNNPSLSLYESTSDDGGILYKDFGNGESGNLFQLLAKIWKCSIPQVYRRILKDMPESLKLKKHRIKKYRKNAGEIAVKTREWRKHDLEYWASYGISKDWLRFGDIHPISHLIITKEGKSYAFPAEKYAYVYVERKDNRVTFKIYQPFSDKMKWISKHDSSVWDLWTKIPECGENLIITSSRKDALCIWANTGIPSLSLQGEGYIPKEHVVQQLKDRYKNIFILYDNDYKSEENHGRMYGRTISDKFNLKQIEIPEKWESKDPSDLCHNHGREVLREVIFELINQKNTKR